MKKDTSKLEQHLQRNPRDANGVISLLKAKSYNYHYDFELARKKKFEKARSFERNRLEV
ncbi:hypothetical protein [Enterococcus gallinarum]|uniref:hypothetical protein n=1 Tax=Enterococcus gallinarum TaxID=1353 RepID=UPI0028054CBC|nr:hypothetical protein [Enterococcus gallinarum]MDT2685799.1 hypothetical protein [Enterococcus gallinarum]